MGLETELRTYQELKPTLLEQAGRHVLIHGDRMLGTYTSREDAVTAGYEKCGLTAFLVKEIQPVERVHFFPWPLSPEKK